MAEVVLEPKFLCSMYGFISTMDNSFLPIRWHHQPHLPQRICGKKELLEKKEKVNIFSTMRLKAQVIDEDITFSNDY